MKKLRGFLGYSAGLLIGFLGVLFSDASNIPREESDIGISIFIRGLMIGIIGTPLLLYLYKKKIIKIITVQIILIFIFGLSGLATILTWGWVSAIVTTTIVCFIIYNLLEQMDKEVQKCNSKTGGE